MHKPLAEKVRPLSIEEVVGQDHLIGPNAPLRKAMQEGYAFSFLLWGPPGSGKTTISRIYASSLNYKFYELSAVSAGKSDIQKIIKEGEGLKKILFLDEIHRFNKAQQDFLLPFVENGDVILIGATTENPSFEIIPALRSRCRLFTLLALDEQKLERIVRERSGINMDDESLKWLVERANGDARQVLGMVEYTYKLYGQITIESLKVSEQEGQFFYDKHGDEHHQTVSAFIKSMRAGNSDAVLYYLGRMIMGGEDPLFIARRMVVFASEDIGLAQPTALVVANEVFKACEVIGLPECRINLAQGAVYLSNCRKDRRVYEGIEKAISDVKKHGNLPIPLKLRNPSTKLMSEAGYGKGCELYDSEGLLPDKLSGQSYFKKIK